MSDTLAPLRKAPGIVRLHGHRAARGDLPENTLLGFRYTFDIGVKIVELDILASRDGVPVITHNPRLMAASTRDQHGNWLTQDGPRIRDLSVAELQSYDIGGLRAGTGYADRYPDQAFVNGLQIPTLADLAALVTEPQYADVWLNIEIKSDPTKPEDTPPLPDYVAQILEVITRFSLRQRCLIQSFDWRVLAHMRDQAPDLPLSFLSFAEKPGAPMQSNIYEGSPWMAGASLADFNGALPDLIKAQGGAVWSPFYADFTAQDVAHAQDIGLIVNAWTVNHLSDVQRAIEAGVDGIITDYPGRVQRHLLGQGLSWSEDVTPPTTVGQAI